MAYKFDVIDVTLRDGSNAVDFQFSKEETYGIVEGLVKAGIQWIELGHGYGLNASNVSKPAKETDETYIRTAREAAGDKAKIGCFFSLGKGRVEDIYAAKEWGLDFLRIGPNAEMEDIKRAIPYVQEAKMAGLIAHACIRKAYVADPNEFAKQVVCLAEAGCDHAMIMDSAGNLLPNQVKEYVYACKDALRGNTDIKIGFHGHDNMGLAVANSLAAVEAGVDSVDTCLNGLGRSAGNANTAYVVAALQRMGACRELDLNALMDVGDKWIGDRAKDTLESIALTYGYAGFHSAFAAVMKKAAAKYGVDPRALVIESCKVDRVDPSEALFEELAAKLAGK